MSKLSKNVKVKRQTRHKKIRQKVKGTKKVPRLNVFRSNMHIYAQLIDDENGITICSLSDMKLNKRRLNKVGLKKDEGITPSFEVGLQIAKSANVKKIKKVVFDRGGFQYHGRIRAVAEGAREGGLKF